MSDDGFDLRYLNFRLSLSPFTQPVTQPASDDVRSKPSINFFVTASLRYTIYEFDYEYVLLRTYDAARYEQRQVVYPNWRPVEALTSADFGDTRSETLALALISALPDALAFCIAGKTKAIKLKRNELKESVDSIIQLLAVSRGVYEDLPEGAIKEDLKFQIVSSMFILRDYV